MTPRCAALAAGLALLAGCALAPPEPPVTLPPVAARGAPAPATAAVRGAAAAFSAPERLHGRPALAAIAVAQLEYLAVELPSGRWGEVGMVSPSLLAARQEVRGALGISSGADPQAVIDSLAAAATAPGGDPAAPALLPRTLFPLGGEETWRRLGRLPRLPQANAATLRALRHWEFGPEEPFDISSLRRF
ncbi:hypothetical protein CR162_07080 [Pseudoroseomonas rhizosphaerae]|uniref:Uncharacterized protein n=1 Tax=Teichococcus rhizosphaerae TaxID=1335062 RepID=A0A2C7AEP8_9PROT|nr:hypothetical protein [Pseudoroseomonas rhizosphaerae]PHK95606.1 hypothetical protein CR162_07080 [Pseudoroseomonas rhizosphaerae]